MIVNLGFKFSQSSNPGDAVSFKKHSKLGAVFAENAHIYSIENWIDLDFPLSQAL